MNKTGHMKHYFRVPVLVTLVVLIWSLSATVEVLTLRRLTPMQFCAWGTAFGAFTLFLILAIGGRMKQMAAYGIRDHLSLALFSVFGYAGYQTLKYTAFTLVPVPQANILQYSYPVFTVIFAAPILKQKFTLSKIIGIFMGFIGAALIFSGGTLTSVDYANAGGYGLALCAGASFALFSVLASRASYEPLSSMFFIQLYTAIIVGTVLLATGSLRFPSGIQEISGILYAGVFGHVLGVLLLIRVQQQARDITFVAGALYIIPFLSLFAFRLFLDIPIPIYALFGLVFIVGGMAFHTALSRLSAEPITSSPPVSPSGGK